MVAAGSLILSACGGAPLSPDQPLDRRGFDAAFYRDLVSGRVWVNSVRSLSPTYHTLEAVYYGSDGRMMSCSMLLNHRFSTEGIWHIVSNEQGPPLLKEVAENSLPKPEHTPLYYDPEWRRLFERTWTTGTGRGWVIGRYGWLQESFPLSLRLLCPDLELPADLPINEDQTGGTLRELSEQTPDAAVLPIS